MNAEPKPKILLVDDDPSLLQSMRRVLRSEFNLTLAESGAQGLEQIRNDGPFAVVVSDHSMPAMSGAQFLREVRSVSPNSVRIMLTGNSDLKSAMDAVNAGQIFRFLTKPTSPDLMRAALKAGIEQHQLVTSQRVLLTETLQGSLKVLMDVLSLVDDRAFGRANRVKAIVKDVVRVLDTKPVWEIEIAAMLSTIGYITVPPEILNKVHKTLPLTESENATFLVHAKAGHDLIANIPHLDGVAKIVLHQESEYDATAASELAGTDDEIPIGSRIIKGASSYLQWIDRGQPHNIAIEWLKKSGKCDPRVVDAIDRCRAASGVTAKPVVRTVHVDDLRPGMIVASNIETVADSILLVRKGQPVTDILLQRLKNFCRHTSINENVKVIDTISGVPAS